MRFALLAGLLLCLSGCNESRIEIGSSQNSDGKWSVSVSATVDSRSRVEAYRSVARTLDAQAKAMEESAVSAASEAAATAAKAAAVKPEAEVKPTPTQ